MLLSVCLFDRKYDRLGWMMWDGKEHGDPISNFAVLVTNLAQGPSLGEGERWSQIRLELPLEQEGGKQIRLELPS